MKLPWKGKSCKDAVESYIHTHRTSCKETNSSSEWHRLRFCVAEKWNHLAVPANHEIKIRDSSYRNTQLVSSWLRFSTFWRPNTDNLFVGSGPIVPYQEREILHMNYTLNCEFLMSPSTHNHSADVIFIHTHSINRSRILEFGTEDSGLPYLDLMHYPSLPLTISGEFSELDNTSTMMWVTLATPQLREPVVSALVAMPRTWIQAGRCIRVMPAEFLPIISTSVSALDQERLRWLP